MVSRKSQIRGPCSTLAALCLWKQNVEAQSNCSFSTGPWRQDPLICQQTWIDFVCALRVSKENGRIWVVIEVCRSVHINRQSLSVLCVYCSGRSSLNPPHLLGPLEKPLQPAFSISCRASFGRKPASQVTLWSDHRGRKRWDQIKTCVSGDSCQLAPGSHKVFPAGIMAVAITPSQQLAAVISSAFYSLWNLFSGFLIPRPVSSVNSALQDAQCS